SVVAEFAPNCLLVGAGFLLDAHASTSVATGTKSLAGSAMSCGKPPTSVIRTRSELAYPCLNVIEQSVSHHVPECSPTYWSSSPKLTSCHESSVRSAVDPSDSNRRVSFAFMVVCLVRQPARAVTTRGHFPRWNNAPRGRSVSTTQ